MKAAKKSRLLADGGSADQSSEPLDLQPTQPASKGPPPGADYSEQRGTLRFDPKTGKTTQGPMSAPVYGKTVPITEEEFNKESKGGRVKRKTRKARGAIEGKDARKRFDRKAK